MRFSSKATNELPFDFAHANFTINYKFHWPLELNFTTNVLARTVIEEENGKMKGKTYNFCNFRSWGWTIQFAIIDGITVKKWKKYKAIISNIVLNSIHLTRISKLYYLKFHACSDWLGTSKRWPINYFTQCYEQQHERQYHALKIPECDTNFGKKCTKNQIKLTILWEFHFEAQNMCSLDYFWENCHITTTLDVGSSNAGTEKNGYIERRDHVWWMSNRPPLNVAAETLSG